MPRDRTLLVPLTLTALSSLLAAQAEDAGPMAPPGCVRVPEAGTTVPLLADKALPTVEVYLGDAGPFHFIVEWAGNVFAVSERTRERADLASLGRFEDGAGHGSELVAVPSLRVGDTHFEHLAAGVFPFFDEADHDGALGLNVFRDLVGTLDFRGRTLRLTKDWLPEPESDASVVEYSPGPGGTPRIPIELGGSEFLAVLDTAAETALIVEERYLDRLELAGELRPGPVIMTPVMGRLDTRLGRIAGELVIGDVRRPEPEAMFHPMQEPEILLGGGFLKAYALTLDQKNRRLRLAPSKKR